ncbi:PucR family transcriptional regulator [uncultured Streptomyces sp.]|uniref:PucR family transcriptional regulator n=1 Tax=uncultured Streptomyces sp. TaxID=174707 RepID=UPI00261D0380|nr:PucR family transcriptional regulator [uncultured Streptomyces sp.]
MPTLPEGPPTPPVPLQALLAREELGLRLIAGPDEASLQWVHVTEMADPYPYLLGGELVLSAGVLLTDPATYVSRLVEAGAAALGFGLRPVHETVPPELVAACERLGLPLLEVPPGTTFAATGRAIWKLMADARHLELRRVTRAQQALATAAARPDPVPAVLHQLATHLEGRAALLTKAGAEVHATGPRQTPAVTAALLRLARVVAPLEPPQERRAPASATDTVDGVRLAAYALGGGQGLVLALATGARDPGAHTMTGMAVVLLSLLAAPHQGTGAADRSTALVRLLLGAGPEAVAPLLGDGGPWTVVHARRTGGAGTDPLHANALGSALASPLVDAGGPDGGPVRVLLTRPDRLAPQPGWTLGASAPTAPGDLTTADALAAHALTRAQATRAPLVRHRDEPGLAGLVPREAAEAHARALLAPLTDTLAETLRCWLSLHGNWDRTATALAVHRNTVRQRVARCAELLRADLDDMDVRTELWFALGQR